MQAETFAPTTVSSSGGDSETGPGASSSGSSGSHDSSGTTTTDGSGNPSGTQPVDCDPGVTQCGVLCVDLQTDADNCGDCGISCVVPNAEASCEAGSCAVGPCEPGWLDCDGAEANGCEAEVDCSQGVACETECGSQGTLSCGTCEAVCELPAEVCNLVDDDCNGACDDGPIEGCRQPVHRANGPNGHYYTTVLAETSQEGRSLEAQDYWFMYTEQQPGMQPLHRCSLGDGRFFLTAHNGCEGGGAIDATLGFIAADPGCGATELYRLVSPAGRHFYTVSSGERDNAVNNLGFTFEAVSGFVWTSG